MAANVFQMITDRMISELEQGRIPWRMPWVNIRGGAVSHVTGKPYSMLNQMLLGRPGEYLTFRQAIAAGGNVKKGEKSRFVVFWKPMMTEKEEADGTKTKKMVYVLKYFNVFHIDQCEGVKAKFPVEELPKPADPIEAAERIIQDYSQRSGCPIRNVKQNQACYFPMMDEVLLPVREQFKQIAEYYSTAFHELVHSTGHPRRLNRLNMTAYHGGAEYSKEELVAEMGAAMMMNETGIETPETFRNSAGYIQSWLRALKDDKRMVVSAAAKAEKAVRLILDMEPDVEEPAEAA